MSAPPRMCVDGARLCGPSPPSEYGTCQSRPLLTAARCLHAAACFCFYPNLLDAASCGCNHFGQCSARNLSTARRACLHFQNHCASEVEHESGLAPGDLHCGIRATLGGLRCEPD